MENEAYQILVIFYLIVGVSFGLGTKILSKDYSLFALVALKILVVVLWMPILVFGALYNIASGKTILGDDRE